MKPMLTFTGVEITLSEASLIKEVIDKTHKKYPHMHDYTEINRIKRFLSSFKKTKGEPTIKILHIKQSTDVYRILRVIDLDDFVEFKPSTQETILKFIEICNDNLTEKEK